MLCPARRVTPLQPICSIGKVSEVHKVCRTSVTHPHAPLPFDRSDVLLMSNVWLLSYGETVSLAVSSLAFVAESLGLAGTLGSLCS